MNRHTLQTLSIAPHSNYLKKGKVVLLTHQITVKGVKMEAGVLDLEEEVDPLQAVVLQEELGEQVVVLVVDWSNRIKIKPKVEIVSLEAQVARLHLQIM